ncbi:MAG: hypothetical protein UV88_C0008G0005 [Parcubacteria group bacterium GW2011_GWA1_43_21]|nr:MAG: hypothetical protein UV50_C0014G0006 [Parcubacteria group bacterium GW2011_GWB1_42_9]KKT09521.1 MAG: hypothetical protein UV88_C0008G0005 [Parcubacteria group bacterium GW2011_GWA1_43_21]
MKSEEGKTDYKETASSWCDLPELMLSLIPALVILFIVGVVVFAVVKWAFQMVF